MFYKHFLLAFIVFREEISILLIVPQFLRKVLYSVSLIQFVSNKRSSQYSDS